MQGSSAVKKGTVHVGLYTFITSYLYC